MKRIVIAFFFVVSVLCASAQLPHVTISVESTTTRSVTASFQKNDACQSYHVLIAKEGELDDYLAMGLTYESMTEMWGIEYRVDATYSWTDMDPNSHYVIYALAVGSGGSELSQADAYTLSQGGGGESIIAISVSEVGDTSARVVCVPNAETAFFYDMLITKSLFDSIGVDTAFAWLIDQPYPYYETDDWLWMTLNPHTEYYAIAVGQNVEGEWGPMAKVLFETFGTSSLHSPCCEKTWRLFPNPAADWVELQGGSPSDRLEIRSVDGKLVLATDGTAPRLSVAHLPAGIYVVTLVRPAGQVSSQRMIKR